MIHPAFWENRVRGICYVGIADSVFGLLLRAQALLQALLQRPVLVIFNGQALCLAVFYFNKPLA